MRCGRGEIKAAAAILPLFAGFIRAEVITPVPPGEAMPKGGTVVWSPLFQAKWDQLISGPGGKPWAIIRAEQLTRFHLHE